MNERIKELAAESKLMAFIESEGLEIIYAHDVTRVEKFAELIIKECINKIETYQIYVGCSPAGELACEWTYNSLKDIRDDIKEHFGVE